MQFLKADMNVTAHEISREINSLPSHLMLNILDYIEFISNKYNIKKKELTKKKCKFKFDWDGGLKSSKLKGQYTSVELQHKALDFRIYDITNNQFENQKK